MKVSVGTSSSRATPLRSRALRYAAVLLLVAVAAFLLRPTRRTVDSAGGAADGEGRRTDRAGAEPADAVADRNATVVRVVDARGSPIPDLGVLLVTRGKEMVCPRTDAHGRSVLSGDLLEDGVRIFMGGFRSPTCFLWVQTDLASGRVDSAEDPGCRTFVAPALSVVNIELRDGDGSLLPSTALAVNLFHPGEDDGEARAAFDRLAGPGRRMRLETDDRGMVRLDSLSPHLAVRFESAGSPGEPVDVDTNMARIGPVAGRFQAAPQDEYDARLRIRPLPRMRLRIRDAEGRPLARAVAGVAVFDPANPGATPELLVAVSGFDGGAVITVPRPRERHFREMSARRSLLAVYHPEHGLRMRSVGFGEEEQDVVLEESQAASGTVRAVVVDDDAGTVVPGFPLELRCDLLGREALARGTTNDRGFVEFRGLPIEAPPEFSRFPAAKPRYMLCLDPEGLGSLRLEAESEVRLLQGIECKVGELLEIRLRKERGR